MSSDFSNSTRIIKIMLTLILIYVKYNVEAYHFNVSINQQKLDFKFYFEGKSYFEHVDLHNFQTMSYFACTSYIEKNSVFSSVL
jgi:hypothetical protein